MTPPMSETRLPSTLRLGVSRIGIETRTFFRNREAMVFTFSLPLLLLGLFATIFSGDIEGPPGTEPISIRQYFVPGMLAAGVMSTTFTSLAISIAIEQHNGLLKRLGGTPLPRAAYFIGKIGMAVVSTVVQAGLMLGAGIFLFDLSFPVDLVHWLAFGWVTVLGVAACSLLGIAFTRLIPNEQSAVAIVQPPYLVLQFISGVFIQFNTIPSFLQGVSSAFPLRWMALGYRYAFLPDWYKFEETGDTWQMERAALVLGAWTVAGFFLSFFFFRWTRKVDG